MNYIDLFSGIGGFALGAYWAGMKFENHYFSEVDSYCVELYQKRFPDAVALGDITKIDTSKLSGNWIITGGFPCQDISIAGKGEGLNGKRSGLWFEMWRIIRDLRPRFAIVENVGALTFRGLTDVLGSLAEIGYDAEWQNLRAEDVGAPHKRERIWITAYSQEDRRERAICSNVKNSKNPMWSECNSSSALDTCLYFFNEFEKRMGEPAVFRMDNGISNKVDRLGSIGNAIVPQIAELLFRQIKELI